MSLIDPQNPLSVFFALAVAHALADFPLQGDYLALGKEDDKLRRVLPLAKWEAISEAIKSEFNERLKSLGLAAGCWGKRQTPVSRLLDKEMLLLAWAIENADPALIPITIANWRGLAPEKRWWLFTMTNAATGHALHGKGRGWRKAVRFALTENPAAMPARSSARTSSVSSKRGI